MSARYSITAQTTRTMGGVLLASLLTTGLSFAEDSKHASSQDQPGTWSTATPLPQARAEHSVIAFDGKVYVIAGGIQNADGNGMQNNGASTLVEYYDPNNNKWQTAAPLPRALTHVGLAALGNKLYAVGGFIGDVHKQAQADAFVYDPVQDNWSEIPSLPQPSGSVATVSLNGKIHAIGGRDPNDRVQATHEIYDSEKRVWTSAAPLPVARDHASAVVANGKIHVIGGRTGDYDAVTAYHDIYDPTSDKWSAAPPLPTPREAPWRRQCMMT